MWNFLWYSFHMPKKSRIIQVPMPEELVESLDRLCHELGESRSAIIREAAAKYIADTEEAENVRRYIESYESEPEDPESGEAGEILAAENWPDEDWREEFESFMAEQNAER
jgi:predicted DNA-binding protein